MILDDFKLDHLLWVAATISLLGDVVFTDFLALEEQLKEPDIVFLSVVSN